MEKEFKKYLKISEEVKRLYKEKKEIDENFFLNNRKYTEEEKERLITLSEETKKASLKSDLQYNNFIYKFLERHEKNIVNIISKYENKAIGEKTKEKINEEVKEEIRKDSIFKNAEIYSYFHGDFKNFDLSIETREKDEKTELFIYDFKIQFEKKTSYNCYEESEKTFFYVSTCRNFSYNFTTLYNLLYLENIEKEVNKILKEEKKQKEKIDKMKEELKETVKKYNNFIASYNIDGEKEKRYKIDTTLYLY